MITLKKEQIEKMTVQSQREAPEEACGLLAGSDGVVEKVYQMTNDEKSGTRYLVNPKQQFAVFKKMRSDDLDLLGIYHSHVNSIAYPSQTDIELATYDVVYFIISLKDEKPEVKAFSIIDGKIKEQPFKVI